MCAGFPPLVSHLRFHRSPSHTLLLPTLYACLMCLDLCPTLCARYANRCNLVLISVSLLLWAISQIAKQTHSVPDNYLFGLTQLPEHEFDQVMAPSHWPSPGDGALSLARPG